MSNKLVPISSFARGALALAIRCAIVLAATFAMTNAQTPAQPSFVTIEGDLKTRAWWVIADFQPFTTEVRGIPASQIQKSWCKATEFRKDLIPRELLFEGGIDGMKASNLSFALEGHFDGSATNQIALVGVYQECSGQKGRFILILDQPANSANKIRFVSALPTDRQFGALAKGDGNTVVAWSCMECGGYSILKWDRKKRRFEWQPASDE